MEKIFHREDEFNQLDWDELIQGDFATNGENYNFGVGGNHYVNGSGLQLTVHKANGDIEVWEVPKVLSRYVVWAEKAAKEEKQNEIKRVLGI